MVAYRNDPAVAEFQDWDLPVVRERVERQIMDHAGWEDILPGRPRTIGIERDGELIGDVFAGLDEHGGVAEIGFTLRTPFQGKGYAFEAASAVVADLIERLGCHRIVAQLSPRNAPSARLLERLGLQVESLAPKSYWCRGAWDDNLTYAMSDEDWRASRREVESPPDVDPAVVQWEAEVADLWKRCDSNDRHGGVAAMQVLADKCPAEDGRAAFELAGMYDTMGLESEAGAAYERALDLGLDEARHAQLAVQYGSTLRNLGRLDEAIAVLQAAPTHATTGAAPRVVLALALHSAGREDEALRVAIEAQIEQLPQYQRSMRNYAAALTEQGPYARA